MARTSKRLRAGPTAGRGEKKNRARTTKRRVLSCLHRPDREESAAYSRRASQKEDQQGESAVFSQRGLSAALCATGRRVTRATRARPRDFRTAIQHPGPHKTALLSSFPPFTASRPFRDTAALHFPPSFPERAKDLLPS